MYFDGAFHQHYLAATTGGVMNYTTSGTTYNLSAGQIGLFLNINGNTGMSAITSGTTSQIMLAMGSWHTKDKLGYQWGGLKEAYCSKGIQPSRVTQFVKRVAQTAQNQIVSIGWNQSSGSSTGPLFYCGTNYTLKVNAQGSPALWFLEKQMYTNLDAWGGCCSSDCSSGCTSTYVDAASILLQWSDRINQSPYLTQFFTPAVYIKDGSGKTQVYSAYDHTVDASHTTYVPNTDNPSSVIACLQLTVAYAETRFGTCTFSPTDHYEVEPLLLQASLVTQNFGECAFNTTMGTYEANMFTEIQAAMQARGLGQGIARAIILSNSYRQDDFPDSLNDVNVLRFREIQDQTVLSDVSLSGYYDQYLILHNISRPYNPTGLHDNDQYALIIDVPAGTDCSQFETIFGACLSAAGNGVSLQTL